MGYIFSSRFIQNYARVCKVNAYINERNTVTEEDYLTIANIMLINRFEQLSKTSIEAIVDDVIILSSFSDTLKKVAKVRELTEKPDLFLEKAIEVIEDTKEEYSEYPQKLKNVIDELRKDIFKVVSQNTKEIKPSMIKRLDTEEFKPLISDYIKIYSFETKFCLNGELDGLKKILAKLKYCSTFEKKEGDYTKFIIRPSLEKVKSFDEIEQIKVELEKAKFLSRF